MQISENNTISEKILDRSEFTLAAIQEDTSRLLMEMEKSSESVGILTIKSGNKWLKDASKRATPLDLFLKLWYQFELCILFADTNVGKSIFAVQIAIELAKTFIVLYIDFELSDKQFENRYSEDYANHYQFPDRFKRAEINTDQADYESAGFGSMEDYLGYSIQKAIEETGATILIIDNLTYLRTETEKAKDALPLMKQLKILKRKFGLSILCLAHTPKRDLSKPITVNDLSGSKMLMNFCDSAFTIGQSSKDISMRYIKQVKARETEHIYHSENVALYNITKPGNFLHFDFQGYATEKEHLKQLTEQDKAMIKEKVIEMHQAGKSYREIGMAMGFNHMRAKRIIEESNNRNKA